MGWLLGRFLCLVGDHEYTCKAEQGIKPDLERINRDPVEYFFEFSQMYCLRCGYIYWKR